MKKLIPIPCRKCGVKPTVDVVLLDGKWQRRAACPKCGLAIYTPQGIAPDCVERWNAVNDRRNHRPDVTAPRRSMLVKESDLGMYPTNDNETASSLLGCECWWDIND